jgi:hypothetical protein
VVTPFAFSAEALGRWTRRMAHRHAELAWSGGNAGLQAGKCDLVGYHLVHGFGACSNPVGNHWDHRLVRLIETRDLVSWFEVSGADGREPRGYVRER